MDLMNARKAFTAEECLKRLERALGVGYWTYETGSGALYWSPGFYALLGLKSENLKPDTSLYNGMLHPEDQRTWDSVVQMARDSDRSVSTVRVIRPGGELRWLRTQYISQFDRFGALVALHGVVADVSDQEIALRNASNRAMLADNVRRMLRGAIWRAGADGRLVDTSDWVRLTGQSAQEARDWETLEAIHPDDREQFRQVWQQALTHQRQFEYCVRVRTRDNHYVSFETHALPVFDRDGALIEWHGYSYPAKGMMEADVQDLSSPHIRAARALLDWTGHDLADRSGTSFSTIKRLEKDECLVKIDTLERVKATLEEAGVRFARDGSGRLSVSCRRADNASGMR